MKSRIVLLYSLVAVTAVIISHGWLRLRLNDWLRLKVRLRSSLRQVSHTTGMRSHLSIKYEIPENLNP